MVLLWSQNDFESPIVADSAIYHDGGVPLPYSIEYDVVEAVWVASFEGAEIGRGTMQEVVQLCKLEELREAT